MRSKNPDQVSKTVLINPSVDSSLFKYCELYATILNNPHKYEFINYDIDKDAKGEPFILFQYLDLVKEQESNLKQKKVTYEVFGEIIFPETLNVYDDIVTDHINQKCTIIIDELCKPKEGGVYKIVVYVCRSDKESFDAKELRGVKTKDGKR